MRLPSTESDCHQWSPVRIITLLFGSSFLSREWFSRSSLASRLMVSAISVSSWDTVLMLLLLRLQETVFLRTPKIIGKFRAFTIADHFPRSRLGDEQGWTG